MSPPDATGEPGSGSPHEVVVVARPLPSAPTPPAGLLGLVLAPVYVAREVVAGATSAALDRIVPAVVDAVLERIDLTELVLSRVDLQRVVTDALDTLDLTDIVLDRVDVDAIVARADIEAVIDRVPIIPLANYVIEEIDLPQIIRESTGGVATDAVNSIRVQSVGADQLVSRMADRFLLRRRQRKVDAPGEPESLLGRLEDDATGSRPVDPVASPEDTTADSTQGR
jgi:hypothetical protein